MIEPAALIIVVDDDFDSLEILTEVLVRRGYRVQGFAEPMEALAAMARDKPALVITDLMMESLDSGFSFARQIKFDPRFEDVPVILLTAAVSQRGMTIKPRTDKDLDRMRIDAYFDKPVDPEALIAKVRELIAGREKGPRS